MVSFSFSCCKRTTAAPQIGKYSFFLFFHFFLFFPILAWECISLRRNNVINSVDRHRGHGLHVRLFNSIIEVTDLVVRIMIPAHSQIYEDLVQNVDTPRRCCRRLGEGILQCLNGVVDNTLGVGNITPVDLLVDAKKSPFNDSVVDVADAQGALGHW